MNYIRRMLPIMLAAAMLALFTFSTVMADSGVIYESSVKQNITSGATLEQIKKFTTKGWLGINILRVDLSNPYVKVDTLINQDSSRKLTSTKTLAQLKGAVAAINGGFFTWGKDSGSGDPIGPVVESGKFITASREFNLYGNSLGTFSLDSFNNALVDYWKNKINLVNSFGTPIQVSRYNKAFNGSTELCIMDRRFSETSVGNSTYSDIIEMVVDSGKVVEIRQQQPATVIPQNGYVVIGRGDACIKLITDNFAVGDEIGLDITITPDMPTPQMAITGGAVLIKDGNIPSTFSYDTDKTPTRQPRTAIGSSEDGKQLIMITVDGRQTGSIGMTQLELANYMKSIGVYNALVLDGGGSTTMVARDLGTSDLTVANSPSDGVVRGVSTAIGVFSIAPPSELDGIVIEAADSNVFVNTSRQLTLKGFDKYFNPVEINPAEVTWSVSGVKGTFKGNIFYPSTVGEGTIKASIGKVTSQTKISVLSSPVQLFLNNTSIKLAPKGTKSFSVLGKNKNGYYASIDPSDVKWTVKGSIGTMSKGIFTAEGKGTGYIGASVAGTNAYCTVSVATTAKTIVDRFEAANGSYTASPKDLPGNYELSPQYYHAGKSSGKLTYDFTNLEGTRAAYMVFPNNGIALSSGTTSIGLWVYNTHKNPNWLGTWIYDSNGTQHMVYLTKEMDWEGWKYLEVSLENIKSPAKLTRIYLVQTNPVADSGSVYFDDLTVSATNYPLVDMKQIPKDTVPVDGDNKSVSYTGSDVFKFAVFGQSSEPGAKDTLKKSILSALVAKINKYTSAGAFVGSSKHEIASSVKKPVVSTNTGYKAFDVKTSRFIQLDMSKKGLRLSNSSQWEWLKQQLDSFKGNNVFIFLADSPDLFSDQLEAGLLQDELTRYKQKTGKNVWVFHKGTKNESTMERGIKYITVAGFEDETLTSATLTKTKYALVTVKGSSVTYEFKVAK